mmetsp:Transcript_21979/g.46237  ORF Transcript_21979/g.46237 Transcript_21979/m.46237 type:complete len:426 (+) Transcript_21979:319-1596(+)
MPLQTLQPRHPHAVLHHILGFLLPIDPHPRPNPQKVKHAQSPGISPRPSGGQSVIRSGAVISQNLRGVSPDEESSVIGAFSPHLFRIGRLNFEMLRCQLIRHGNTLLHILTQNGKRLFQRLHGGRSIRLRQTPDLPLHLTIDLVDDPGIVAHQNRPRHDIVLRLRYQIRRHDLRIRRSVRDDQDLRRTRQHVDPAMSVHQRLGRGDPFVPRADDDVAGRDGRADAVVGSGDSVGHAADGLGASDAEDDVGAGDVGGGEGDGGGAGGGEDDVGAAGGAGGDDGHEDGGGEGVASSRGVASGGSTRTNRMPRLPPRNIYLHIHHALPLRLRKGLHPPINIQQTFPIFLFQPIKGLLALFGRDDVIVISLGQVAQTTRHGEEGGGTDDGGVGGAEFREDGFGLGEGRGVDGVFDFEGYFVGGAAGKHV